MKRATTKTNAEKAPGRNKKNRSPNGFSDLFFQRIIQSGRRFTSESKIDKSTSKIYTLKGAKSKTATNREKNTHNADYGIFPQNKRRNKQSNVVCESASENLFNGSLDDDFEKFAL
jgi:hypothetical protein